MDDQFGADRDAMPLPSWYGQWIEEAVKINDRTIFFILGCQKSGTTWVQHLLDAHPNIACAGEGHITDLILPLMKQSFESYEERQRRRPPGFEVMFSPEDLAGVIKILSDRLLAQYLREGGGSDRILAIGDKTPENAIAMGLLNDMYPVSKFVHVIRDGRDAAVSGWAHVRRQGGSDQFTSFGAYVEYFAEYHWVPYITCAREAGKRFPDRYLEIRYENLHDNPAQEVQRILDFLEVDMSGEAIARCLEGGSFEKLSGGRTRGEEDTSSFFRKGVVGEWTLEFDEVAIDGFEKYAGELLNELGYKRQPVGVGVE